jgi:hypothetical protein
MGKFPLPLLGNLLEILKYAKPKEFDLGGLTELMLNCYYPSKPAPLCLTFSTTITGSILV